MTQTERLVERLLKLLEENVPAPMKENFMITLGSILGSAEGNKIDRIDLFNPVYARLHEEKRRRLENETAQTE